MNTGDALFPVIVVGQAVVAEGNALAGGLMTYGPLGLWVLWMLYRDKRESDKADKRHEDNLEQQQKIEVAFRTTTTAVITAVSALQNVDESYSRLLKKIEAENAPK